MSKTSYKYPQDEHPQEELLNVPIAVAERKDSATISFTTMAEELHNISKKAAERTKKKAKAPPIKFTGYKRTIDKIER